MKTDICVFFTVFSDFMLHQLCRRPSQTDFQKRPFGAAKAAL
ncbi:hypothetical protein [Segatella baroniae]|nr:hypothetical protein [Segatella baroniae]